MGKTGSDLIVTSASVDAVINYVTLFNDINDAGNVSQSAQIPLSNPLPDGSKTATLKQAKAALPVLKEQVLDAHTDALSKIWEGNKAALKLKAGSEVDDLIKTVATQIYPQEPNGQNFGRHIGVLLSQSRA